MIIMRKNRLLLQGHAILTSLISKDDIVIDATMGQGYDTYLLGTLAKEVYAFDIQEEALHKTALLTQNLHNVHLICDSHENMFNYITYAKGYIFNLGYLPKGNKAITTTAETTLKTLMMIQERLRKDDFIHIMVYKGHDEGLIEHNHINDWLKTLSPHAYQVIVTEFYDKHHNPPYLILIYKTL